MDILDDNDKELMVLENEEKQIAICGYRNWISDESRSLVIEETKDNLLVFDNNNIYLGNIPLSAKDMVEDIKTLFLLSFDGCEVIQKGIIPICFK